MAHRYAAGTLSLFIFLLAYLTYKTRKNKDHRASSLPFILIGIVFFQAALGMWTVTLKLLPMVVMGHLLGGMLILGTLAYFRWQMSPIKRQPYPKIWRIGLNIAVLIVFIQIALGGWVSANYAGIACIGFPTCNGVWFPKLDCSHAFQMLTSLKVNYQGGLLDSSARISIQMIHRVGALITTTYSLILSSLVLKQISTPIVRKFAIIAIFCVLLQVILGVINVLYLLPLSIAVAHNGVAAALFSIILSLRYLLSFEGATNVCPRTSRIS
jgi:cytochrome c oxidase assembly protein subunit 15